MKLVHDAGRPLAPSSALCAAKPAADSPRVLIRCEGRSVTSAAQRRRRPWVLRGEPSVRPPIDPLMGWCGDADTHSQIELRFATLEEAMAFARRRGWSFEVVGANFSRDVDAAPTASEAEQAMLCALAHYAWLDARYGSGELPAVDVVPVAKSDNALRAA